MTHEEHEKCTKFSIGKHEGKIPLGILRRRWKDNIKTDFRRNGEDADGFNRPMIWIS
jgi:hypothetical protein